MSIMSLTLTLERLLDSEERVKLSERSSLLGWHDYGTMELGRIMRLVAGFSPGSWIKFTFSDGYMEGDLEEVRAAVRERMPVY